MTAHNPVLSDMRTNKKNGYILKMKKNEESRQQE
jgi:hypothetical protein